MTAYSLFILFSSLFVAISSLFIVLCSSLVLYLIFLFHPAVLLFSLALFMRHAPTFMHSALALGTEALEHRHTHSTSSYIIMRCTFCRAFHARGMLIQNMADENKQNVLSEAAQLLTKAAALLTETGNSGNRGLQNTIPTLPEAESSRSGTVGSSTSCSGPAANVTSTTPTSRWEDRAVQNFRNSVACPQKPYSKQQVVIRNLPITGLKGCSMQKQAFTFGKGERGLTVFSVLPRKTKFSPLLETQRNHCELQDLAKGRLY